MTIEDTEGLDTSSSADELAGGNEGESGDDPVDSESPADAARRVQFRRETAAREAALAALAASREGRKAEAAGAEDDVEEAGDDSADDEAAKVAAAAKVAPPKKEEPAAPPEDKSAALLSRLTAAESESRAMKAQLKELNAAVARTKSLEAAMAKANAGDAADLFALMNWSPDTVLKYVEGGKDGIKDEVAARKIATVDDRVAQLEAQLAAERNQREVSSYKATLSRELAPISKDVPFLANYHTDHDTGVVDYAGMAEAVFDFQFRLHQANREVSISEAAKALNDAHEKQFKRLQGKAATSSKPADEPATKAEEASSTPAKKPVQVVKKPRVSLPEREMGDPHEAAALAVLKSNREARRKEAAMDLD